MTNEELIKQLFDEAEQAKVYIKQLEQLLAACGVNEAAIQIAIKRMGNDER